MPFNARTAILVKQATNANKSKPKKVITTSNVSGKSNFAANVAPKTSLLHGGMGVSAAFNSHISFSMEASTETVVTCRDEDKIKFTAFVSDKNAWNAIQYVSEGSEVKFGENKYLVTGRIDPEKLEDLAKNDFVHNIQVAREFTTCATLSTIQKDVELQQIEEFLSDLPEEEKKGNGVVIGIIDDGADFNHANFKNDDGTSRIEFIWDQIYSEKFHSKDVKYGRLITKKEIDDVLASNSGGECYSMLGYDPGTNSHGTHVMDIAAGKDGVSPKSSIIFVDIPWKTTIVKSADNSEKVERESLASSKEVIDALQFIFDKAGDRPCVVNLSIGEPTGPHDGTSDVELTIEAKVREKLNRAVVVAAGNFRHKKLHKSGKVIEKKSTIIKWIADPPPNYDKFDTIEIWYSKNDDFDVEISFGDNSYVIELGEEMVEIADEDDTIICTAGHTINEDNGDKQIYISRKPKNKEIWEIALTGNRVQDGEYHAYIELHGQNSISSIDEPTMDCTLSSIATGISSIAVGCYREGARTNLSYFSSYGPTRTGLWKPELSALGDEVFAAGSKSKERTKYSGTSQSAPVITGIIARLLSVAKARGKELSIENIREIIINSASMENLNIKDIDTRLGESKKPWHAGYGYGRVTSACFKHELLTKPTDSV